ncbi:ribosomal protein S18 acetylase RimI-like enzyme [Planomicrobium stackebrandtii]|uniref:Ribosomal protein S18 acetylase RimI-like enzyme n=1 Tax=Planomicrobium stackebrandtii TaxID=253160 RepID=A0ABU0GPJ9_9BACL|nr:GNAT family N-acetyltransferase [Planomicrobium stackebrandtii]MDQ0427257.1 ribosomal protein S18 acetylase RimI-like enzyme [Planomicrobium stackebrandtii]
MHIERVTLDTVERVVPLFDGYRQFYGQQEDKQAAHHFLEERILKEESIIFIAFVEGEAAGFVQLYPIFSSVSLKRAYILNDLYVDPRFRKQGAGKQLMEKSFEYCEEKDARFVALETATDNVQAQKLYEQMGMNQEEMLHYSKVWEK